MEINVDTLQVGKKRKLILNNPCKEEISQDIRKYSEFY